MESMKKLADDELDRVSGGGLIDDVKDIFSHTYTCGKCGRTFTRSQALDAVYICEYGGCFCDSCIAVLKKQKAGMV